MKFNFPVGYHDFHKVKIIDFQLNRWYSLGYTQLEDTIEVSKNIHKLEDWKPEMIKLAILPWKYRAMLHHQVQNNQGLL